MKKVQLSDFANSPKEYEEVFLDIGKEIGTRGLKNDELFEKIMIKNLTNRNRKPLKKSQLSVIYKHTKMYDSLLKSRRYLPRTISQVKDWSKELTQPQTKMFLKEFKLKADSIEDLLKFFLFYSLSEDIAIRDDYLKQ